MRGKNTALTALLALLSGGAGANGAAPPALERSDGLHLVFDGSRMTGTPLRGPDYTRYGWRERPPDGPVLRPFEPGARIFTDRAYPVGDIPPGLSGRLMIHARIDGAPGLDCTRAGKVIVLSPVKLPRAGYQGDVLLRAGFKKMDFDPFQLFGDDPINRVEGYRKTLPAGDRIELGKYAVILVRKGAELIPRDGGAPEPGGREALVPFRTLAAREEPDLRRRGQVVRVAAPPRVDGALDDPAWQDIPGQSFRNLRSYDEWRELVRKYLVPPRLGALSTIRLAHDGRNLYLALRCTKQEGYRHPWTEDDGVEIFLQTEDGAAVHRMAVRADGAFEGIAGARAAVRDHAGHFAVEAAIPLSALGLNTPVPGRHIRGNFGRIERPSREPTAWSKTSAVDDPDAFGILTFVDEPRPMPEVSGRIVTGRVDKDSDRLVVESPAGIFLAARDGRIFITYDHGRSAPQNPRILMSVVREEDIQAGRIVSEDGALNRVIARAGHVDGD